MVTPETVPFRRGNTHFDVQMDGLHTEVTRYGRWGISTFSLRFEPRKGKATMVGRMKVIAGREEWIPKKTINQMLVDGNGFMRLVAYGEAEPEQDTLDI